VRGGDNQTSKPTGGITVRSARAGQEATRVWARLDLGGGNHLMLTPDTDAYPVLTLVDGGPVQWVGRNHGLPDGKRISRQHCQFWMADGAIVMQDGSACGTWLNDSRMEKAQPVALRPGDVVSFPTGVDVSPTYKCGAATRAGRGKQRAETSAVAAPKRQRASPKSKAPAPAPALDRRQLAALAAERRAEAEAGRRAEDAAEAKAKAEAETEANAKAKGEAEVKAAAARLAAATKAEVEAKAQMEAEEAEEAEEATLAERLAARRAAEEAAADSAGGGSGGSAGGAGAGAGGDGGGDDDECVFVKEDDAKMLNLPHARFDCRK
jgi:pSer/pThr/pTyr-binding forkhead associated (FHA) protein